MRDLPLFTTDNGVADLFLKEIPYSGAAYIRIHCASDPQALLDECLSFCRAVDANAVYAADHPVLSQYPVYTTILEMRCPVESLQDTDAALFPVQRETISIWRQMYNGKMAGVDGSSYMTIMDSEKLLKRGNGYFIHRGDSLLGIGIASGDRIEAVVSNVPGCGKDVVLALTHALSGDCVTLEVADTNIKAIKLYQRLGFLPVRELTVWHKIF